MSGETKSDYLRRRAAEERQLSAAARDATARLAHRQLAELFEREAEDADEPIPYLIE